MIGSVPAKHANKILLVVHIENSTAVKEGSKSVDDDDVDLRSVMPAFDNSSSCKAYAQCCRFYKEFKKKRCMPSATPIIQ